MKCYILYSSIVTPLLSLPCSSTKKIRAYIISNLKKYIKNFCNSFVNSLRPRIHSDSNEKTTPPASSEKFDEKFSVKILPASSEKFDEKFSIKILPASSEKFCKLDSPTLGEENNLQKPNLSNFTLNSPSTRNSTFSLDSTSSQSSSTFPLTSTYSISQYSMISSQDSTSSQMITILPDEMKPIF